MRGIFNKENFYYRLVQRNKGVYISEGM